MTKKSKKNTHINQGSSRSSRYTNIILMVVTFIILFVGILSFNFYVVNSLSKETAAIDIASRQGTLSQRITRAITEFELLAVQQYLRTIETLNDENDLDINDSQDDLLDGLDISELSSADYARLNDEEILTDEQIELDNFFLNRMEKLRNEIRDYSDVFDWTLSGFREGGNSQDIDGKAISLSQVPEGRPRAIVEEASKIWLVFKDNINILLYKRVDEYINRNSIDTTLKTTSEYARAQNVRLLNLMNELARELTNRTTEQAQFLRRVQFGGIALALLFFLVIIYYILLRFRSADRKLDLAKQQTDEIMANVSGGLFLLNSDFEIASAHSAELVRIFNNNDLGGKRFDHLLKDILPRDTLDTSIDYINLLMGDRVNEKLVADLNPMDEVEVNFPDNQGSFQTKYLEFDFNRTVRDGKVAHLLVSVTDISDRVKLSKELEESYENREAQLELLMRILHINPQELLIFIDEAELSLNNINDILRESNSNIDDNRNKVSKIFRIAHSLKGDSSALGLESFERMAHQFEDELDSIRKMKSPSGNDFIPLVVKLEDMLSHMQSIKEIALRLSELGAAVSQGFTEKDNELEDQEKNNGIDNVAFLHQLKEKICRDLQKDVKIDSRGIDQINIPPAYRKVIREALVQFTRNSIVHGIELPNARTAVGKKEAGNITTIFHQLRDENYELIFRDDGQGVNKDRVKEAAVEAGIVDADKVDFLTGNQIYGLIFHPGFSTADKTSEHAGRGVGMDIIRANIKAQGGKIKFKTSPGQFTEFRIILPAEPTEVA